MTRTQPLVIYWNNLPSPYMVDRFNAFADRGECEFEVWFSDRLSSDRSWHVNEETWRFRYRYLPKLRLLGRTFHWPVYLLRRRSPDLLVSLYSEPAFLLGWAIAKVRGTRTCFRVLMTFDQWVPRHPFKEAIKRFIFSRVDGIETPGADGRRYAMRYGAEPGRIFLATHTVDIDYFLSCRDSNELIRLSKRRELGLVGVVFAYVGRLWWGKGVQYLLEAFEKVQRGSSVEVSLLLVGDGAEERPLSEMCRSRQIRNVVLAGFKQKVELPLYYALADVFVFPTLGDPYGVAVDEAMASSLPIISTSAAGEIRERVVDWKNGFIVPPADSDRLADRMLYLANNEELRRSMGQQSESMISQHTPERWAAEFATIVNAVLGAR